MHLQPFSRQRELIALARCLARERFAPRADRHDRNASFPFDDYADLRAEGLLGLCVPERYGGLGADYETYCLVAEQLAQGNASTALTFNMHCLTMLMMGPIADNMAMPPAVRERHEKLRAAKFREVVEDGAFYGQPHSEPVEQGETDTTLGVGGRRFGTPGGPQRLPARAAASLVRALRDARGSPPWTPGTTAFSTAGVGPDWPLTRVPLPR